MTLHLDTYVDSTWP